MTLGEFIKKRKEEMKLKWKDFEDAGISSQTISCIINNKQKSIMPATREKLATVLKCSQGEIQACMAEVPNPLRAEAEKPEGNAGISITAGSGKSKKKVAPAPDPEEPEETFEVDEPEEATFSDTDDFDLYVTRYYSSNTVYMDRLFSEAANDVETSQEEIEDAIENGEQIENDSEIVTPVDANTAVIEDKENEEFTKVTINDNELHFRPIGEGEAEELTSHLHVDSTGAGSKSDEDRVEEGREETKDFSDTDDIMEKYFSESEDEVYCDEDETKFFSESEEMTDYMVRLFSEESDSEKIEDAIESGEEIENDTEIITPVDAKTAVVEDKENGEFTKAELSEGEVELHPISEEEAEELTKDVVVESDDDDDDNDDEDENKDEKKFSDPLGKFFAEVAGPAAPEAPQTAEFIVDEQGNPVQPVAAVAAEPAAAGAPVVSPEAIEDKALAAVQSIQAAAAEMEAQVLNAKAAPVEGAEQDLQEAQFSEKTFSEEVENNTTVSWLRNNLK